MKHMHGTYAERLSLNRKGFEGPRVRSKKPSAAAALHTYTCTEVQYEFWYGCTVKNEFESIHTYILSSINLYVAWHSLHLPWHNLYPPWYNLYRPCHNLYLPQPVLFMSVTYIFHGTTCMSYTGDPSPGNGGAPSTPDPCFLLQPHKGYQRCAVLCNLCHLPESRLAGCVRLSARGS